jgi:predicted nucleic acid-binding protein
LLLVDTGVLVATADTADRDHESCRSLLETAEGPLVTTAMVIAEAAYLIGGRLGASAEAKLYTSILEGELRVEELTAPDWARIQELVTTYADLGLGGTDAGVVAVAERLRVGRVATLDHRHFRVVRPQHLDAFKLVPDLARP